jgi:quinol monooxygenase YgiN
MANVWTHGTWTVKPGKEGEFTEAWLALVRESSGEHPPAEPPTLLRDREEANVFVSFGPWPDYAAVERFLSSDAFRDAQARMRDLLDSFQPRTLDEVSHG